MLQAVFFSKKAYSMKQIHNDNNMSCTDFGDITSSDGPANAGDSVADLSDDEGENAGNTSVTESGRLSTIPEGSNEDDHEFLTFVSSYFSDCSADDSERIREVYNALQRESAEIDEDQPGNLDQFRKTFYAKPVSPTVDFNVYAHLLWHWNLHSCPQCLTLGTAVSHYCHDIPRWKGRCLVERRRQISSC